MISDIDEPLRLTVSGGNGAESTIALEGELDPHTAPLLEDALLKVGTESSATVVLEMSRLEFMDSSGLRVIVNAHKGLDERGAKLVIRNPSPTIGRLFDLTNLRAHLNVEG